jgi:hypothetical protein
MKNLTGTITENCNKLSLSDYNTNQAATFVMGTASYHLFEHAAQVFEPNLK